jgi:hypothetical protein
MAITGIAGLDDARLPVVGQECELGGAARSG